ncbi:MAG: hypothetical protein LBG79_01435 [Spirochaetaceae bacterium]|nr:hypothetical protein [Spirochaetaceae bacterium]
MIFPKTAGGGFRKNRGHERKTGGFERMASPVLAKNIELTKKAGLERFSGVKNHSRRV